MTQTVSFSEKFKSGFALFKSELKSCVRTLIVFSLIAAVFITFALTLCIVGGFSAGNNYKFDFENLQNAITVFQYVAAYFVFFLNAVFTIVYTIRIYSYLHNKRKADLYGSMPISRRTFYISKTVSAYILSITPALFFFGIISIISVGFGVPVTADVAMLYVKLLIGAIACISFYGLLAVCSGTTLNTVLSFIAINFAYPISTLYIRGTIKAFFWGMPTNQYNSSFIMKALNPLAAYDGTNIIYWLIFTAVCLFLGIWLVKKRKAECAQTSFAFYLPCYIVELLIAFILGMFVGVIFGSMNVLFNGYLGFIFGFTLGSVPALIITHLILYKGFAKFWKSAIIYGGLAVTVVALMAVCNFDFFGYNSYIPAEEDVKSAGLIDLDNCYCAHSKGALGLANMASDDYDDSKNIETIIKFHQSVDKASKRESYEKFGSVWMNMLYGSISSEYLNDSYCIAYRLNNGMLTYRYYTSITDYYYNDHQAVNLTYAEKIIASDTYFMNYSKIMNSDVSTINSLEFSFHFANNDAEFDSYNNVIIAENENVDAKTAKSDRELVIEAYLKDIEEKGREDKNKITGDLYLSFEPEVTNDGSLLNTLAGIIDGGYSNPELLAVYSDYTNTIDALKEIGVLNENNRLDKNGKYYQGRTITNYSR